MALSRAFYRWVGTLLTEEAYEASQGRWPAGGHHPRANLERSTVKRPERIRLFKNIFVEKVLGQSHPILPIVWFGPAIAYGIYHGWAVMGLPAWGVLGLFLFGFLCWTLLEYCLHRFVFHAEEDGTPEDNIRWFMVHGYHHEFTQDKMRLVAPPLMSWPLAIVVYPTLYFIFGPVLAGPVISGITVGYISYDWTHYYTHHFSPTTFVGKWLRAYHLQHHYSTPAARYGVSNPLWDFVFRTYVPVKVGKAKPRSGDSPSGDTTPVTA